MTPLSVGILGVGHLTAHMVPGLCGGKVPLDVILSPRNAERAGSLAGDHALRIASDNRQLVEDSSVVVIGLRQVHAIDAVRGLPWRADHTVISCCAGLALADLAPHLGGAALVRAMPTIAAVHRDSPTCIFPENETAARVLGNCGSVIPLSCEDDFNAATVVVCYSSMLFGLMAHMTEWCEDTGLAPDTARRLVGELTRSTGTLAVQQPDTPLARFVSELATQGSYTRAGFESLQRADAFRPWVETSDRLLEGLVAGRSPPAEE